MTNVRGWNAHSTGGYGKIGAVFRGIMQNVFISDVAVDVSCRAIFWSGSAPSSIFDLQPFMLSRYVFAENVYNHGYQDYVAFSDSPWNGTWAHNSGTVTVDYEKNVEYFRLENIKTRGMGVAILEDSLKADAPAEATTFDATTYLDWTNILTSSRRSGHFSQFNTSSLSNTSADEVRMMLNRAVADSGLTVINDSGTAGEVLLSSSSYKISGGTSFGDMRVESPRWRNFISGTLSFQVDGDSTAGNTRMSVYDVDNAALERVSVGAADSGGSGFKLLRIPN